MGRRPVRSPLLWSWLMMTAAADSSLSYVRLFETPWTAAQQAPLSMGFPRQEYWSGLPFPSPGDLSDAGIEPTSAWQVDSLPLSRQENQRRQILGVGFSPYPATVGCASGYVGNPRSLWVASPTQWTRVWASSRKWWRTGKPGVVQSMGSQRVRATEQLNNNAASCSAYMKIAASHANHGTSLVAQVIKRLPTMRET